MNGVIVKDRGVLVRNRGVVVGPCPDCCGNCGDHYCCQNTGGMVNPPRPYGWPFVAGLGYHAVYTWSASGTMSYSDINGTFNRNFNTGTRIRDVYFTPGSQIGCSPPGDQVAFNQPGTFNMLARVSVGPSTQWFLQRPDLGYYAGGHVSAGVNPGFQTSIHGIQIEAAMVPGFVGVNATAALGAEDFDGGYWGSPNWSTLFAAPAANASGMLFPTAPVLGSLNQYGFRTTFQSSVSGFGSGLLFAGQGFTASISATFFLSLDGVQPCCPQPGLDYGPLMDALR